MSTTESEATACSVREHSAPVDLLQLHRAHPQRYPFLLESSAGAHAQGRYDLLLAFPGEHLTLEGTALAGRAPAGETDFLRALDSWYAQEDDDCELPPDLPFAGGWFVYLGYELAAQIEPRLHLAQPGRALPTALAVRCPAAVIRDRVASRTLLVAEDPALVPAMQADLARLRSEPAREPALTIASVAQAPAQAYLEQVARIREYIRAGDVFQVNLAREWCVQLAAQTDPASVYAALRRSNPAPFSGLMCWRDAAVISSSPERLLRLHEGIAQTRPIAGTRPRTGEDSVMTRELLAHPKERAEHVMLIDLERNDLGRVCRYGSIEVNELMSLESYAHVHHIVSNVRGRLRPDVGPGAALRAVFPGGTITGCPKLRCMEIIAELEDGGRGAYTGAFAYISRGGRMDSNILIRSLEQTGTELRLRAGAGIVADSDPVKELEETRAKARGVMLSLGLDV